MSNKIKLDPEIESAALEEVRRMIDNSEPIEKIDAYWALINAKYLPKNPEAEKFGAGGTTSVPESEENFLEFYDIPEKSKKVIKGTVNTLAPRAYEQMSKDINTDNSKKTFKQRFYEELNQSGKNANAFGIDAITGLNRAIASTPETIGAGLSNAATRFGNKFRGKDAQKEYGPGIAETFVSGMRDTEGSNPVGKFVRNPSTSVDVLSTMFPPAKLLKSMPFLRKIANISNLNKIGTSKSDDVVRFAKDLAPKTQALARGTATSVTAAGATQAENINEEKDFNPVEFGSESALGIGGSFFGLGGSKSAASAINKGADKLTPWFVRKSVDKLDEVVKPTGNMRATGWDIDVLNENQIVGSPSEALGKTKQIIAEHSERIKNIIYPQSSIIAGGGVKQSMNVAENFIEPTVDVHNLIKQMAGSSDLRLGFQGEQTNALADLYKRVSQVSKDGNIKISDIPKVKYIIATLRGGFDKPPIGPVDEVLGRTYHALDEKFLNVIENTKTLGKEQADAIRASNKKIHELIPIADVLDKRIAQGVERKIEPGVIMGALGKSTNLGNIGTDYVVSQLPFVPQGAVFAAKVGKEIVKGSAPKIGKNIVKKTDLEKSVVDMRIRRKILKGERLDNLDLKELAERQAYRQAKRENKLQSNLTLLGSMGGQGSMRMINEDRRNRREIEKAKR